MKHLKSIVMSLLAAALLFTAFACTPGGSNTPTADPNPGETAAPVTPSVDIPVTDPENSSLETNDAFSITVNEGAEPNKNGSVYTISAAGEYVLSGRLENGQVVVSARSEDEVRIVLNNAYISSVSSSPILARSGKKITVKSETDSYNVIKYTPSVEPGDYDAAIWADTDLKMSGHGTLIVSSTCAGIKTKDDLSVKNVALKVASVGNALRGSDSVCIESGTLLLISSETHGIKTSNTDVSSKGNQRGTVLITGGSVCIMSANNGISSAYNTQIAQDTEIECSVAVYAGAYAGFGSDAAMGICADNEIIISGGELNVHSVGDGLHANADKRLENGSNSVGNITVSGGTVGIECDDDALHADGSFTVSNGAIAVTRSHEALEANVITVSGGTVSLYGEDDGINAQKGREEALVNITGGTLQVTVPDGGADAIDSNGDLTMSGGLVLLRSGASQAGTAGSVEVKGRVIVTGGTIAAIGGIASTPTSDSINNVISSGTVLPAGSYTVSDASGNTVLSFSLDAEHNSFWFASDRFELNESYSLSSGGTAVASWTQSAQTVHTTN
ncbi:MAG: carbohydrate-binding domain-containing protein [Clostridia bacterium]|nr:carbohydrate-binding domain-containing protein [Clostridia bacterium]